MKIHKSHGFLNSNQLHDIKKNIIERLIRPYATVFLCYSPWAGLWFALLSFTSPRTAISGVFSLLCTWMWGKILSIKPPGDLHLVNGLLCGLFLSAYYPISSVLITGLIIITLFITISVNWLSTYLWYMGRIPLMTFPFVLGTWLLMLVFHESNITSLPVLFFLDKNLPDVISWEFSNNFFSAVGGLMLVPHPLPGVLIFLGLLISSRYLAFLAVSGYIVGAITLFFLDYNFLEIQNGYNFILVSMALGGIFMVPSRISYLIALGGSALTALFTVALFKVMDPFNLPVLIMPFLLSTYFWLGGLGQRMDKNRGLLNLEFPVSPEITWENNRLNQARGINLDSTPVMRLFKGEWLVDQDSKTERVIFSKDVAENVDQQIYAPTDALVLSLRNSAEETHIGPLHIVLNKGWGSFLLLRDRLGQYIFLPRLKSGSIKVKPGEWVNTGQPIATCGKLANNSKYCIYLQIQKGVMPNSDRVSYHLVNMLSHEKDKLRRFNLFYPPAKGDYVIEASRDEDIAQAMRLPPAEKKLYTITDPNNQSYTENLQTGMTPVGQPRLYSSQDISAGYEESSLSLVLYDRQGKSDILLDVWMLAMGLTPLTNQAEVWNDKPSLKLWPLNLIQRLFVNIVHPLGVGCESRYTRTWNKDSKNWVQNGVHRAEILPGIHWKATTSAIIDPKLGVCYIKFEMFGRTWKMTLEGYKP